jgi:hypothetical protein
VPVTPTTSDRRHGRGALLLAAGAALLALCLAAVVAGPSVDRADAARAKTLGKTKKTPSPSCPGGRTAECEAVGSVTGFQTRAGGVKNPFKVKQSGQLVAWSVDLSRPKPSERRFFGRFYRSEAFGTAPAARVSVLKPKGKKRYKLKRHGPAVNLTEHLGQKPIFTLGTPLAIKKGDVLALSIPSWAPNFAIDQSRKDAWRASRATGKCSSETDLKKGRTQEKVGKSRVYGCTYRTARLLYWGYYTTGG